MELRELLIAAAAHAADFREQAAEARVFPETGPEAVRDALGTLPEGPAPAAEVVDELVKAAEPALVANTGPRYFGFVTGGALDAATAADVLTTGWDQNGFNAISSPAAAAVEDVAASWLKELLGLPATASSGFVTGGQAANTVCLAAARHHVLARAGWDVERDGLPGAPRIRVVVNADRHATIDRSLRLLGLGTGAVVPVRTDPQGRTDVGELARVLSDVDGPSIVCLQAGDVNTGSFDDFPAAVEAAHRRGAWVHVDGAVGLWAAASPTLRPITAGVEAADSWSTDGHKWLNVPYDSGYAFCAHPEAHAAATAYTAAYLTGQDGFRAPSAFALESSRRARGFATWAALRQLGRGGLAELVDRCCALARRFAGLLADAGVEIGNEVVLNQVLAAFGDDERTRRVLAAVQRSGVCWMGGTRWHGREYMRISVSSWRTTAGDVDRAAGAVLSAFRRERGAAFPAAGPP
ncbi:aminotransferase class V-fold PLP-dependent enzyme [Amycolatopsis acidiphila]|uniref:Aspartate aminotransferase family protein n=1 Tax=Amycolatopsis acidiphila TaxID=715473 RepID=A0A558AGC9_9PSEU|nr:aminotransferase class V-fold PLP-dependent enzyme [Amycolatopsis acidiphila]TVT23286.1 aspartate aminotransferase family protein [Amycolatopsis acidiphila]UIJ56510.1 aminotransferase class V-fold PLP-dependent enzyme [Amycolatopsis acidiphila]GHG66887.1 aspartate aminotransferase family protein [Amycolatopsis acidiphila]